MKIEDAKGRKVGDAICGVYAFYDYDGEPIYVGQTYEKLRSRISRHLTNQRTDAVAMNVLDPFEVAEIELWPFWDLEGKTEKVKKNRLNAAEFTVFQKLLAASTFKAVLNEKSPAKSARVKLPKSVRERIVPEDVYKRRRNTDIRIARRARTIANLAQVISERSVQIGLRQTLLTQARRLEHLARLRVKDVDD
jgi:GIY-YIG catalytic domain